MIIRRDDFNDINKLTKGSKKIVWFICDNCNIGVKTTYQTYLKTETDLCRKCRNKHTANREDVKKKQSIASKRRWENPEHRKKTSKSLSSECKRAWDNDDGSRRKWLSENNPMKNRENREKVAIKEAVSDKEISILLHEIGYKFRYKELGFRGGSVVYFICDKGHKDNRRLDAIRHGARCRYCYIGSSKGERELQDYIIGLVGTERCVLNTRKFIYPYELDIIIDNKIGIEYCGLYYHSEEKNRDKNYHITKLDFCNKNNIQLIQVFEDEWVNKKDIVKNRIKHKLSICENKFYARNCKIKEINTKTAKDFCEKYHIQGYGKSNIKLGMFHENVIVSVMTFSKPNISKGKKLEKNKIEWELNRYCSSVNIIGGFSKLLSYFKKNFEWNVIYSYVDKRWNSGKSYEKIGFKFSKNTKPNYWYCKRINENIYRYHRYNFRKDKLKEEGTEREIMKRRGWYKVWDCGNIKYIMENK